MAGLNQVLFRICDTQENGRHLVAIRDIFPGELIFSESPASYGPGDVEGVCIVCLDLVRGKLCDRCWWPVCGNDCKNSKLHKDECRLLSAGVISGTESSLPVRHLVVLRLLLLKNNQRLWTQLLDLQSHQCGGHLPPRNEEDLLEDQGVKDLIQFVRDCGLTKITISDLTSLHQLVGGHNMSLTARGGEFPGLFLTGALLTQSCVQNTRAVYKGNNHRLHLYAATNIKRGDKITHSRLKNLVLTGTLDRRKELHQIHRLECQCVRCSDQTELGTNLSSILCQRCDDQICLPLDPGNKHTQWKCRGCDNIVTASFVSSLLLSLQEDLEEDILVDRLKTIREKTREILPDNHFLVLAEKSKYFLKHDSVSSEDQLMKVKIGKEMLQISDLLEPGLSAYRESILVNLGIALQILLGSEIMSRYTDSDEDDAEEDDDGQLRIHRRSPGLLSDHQMFAAFRDASFCFKQALEAARLEEDPDDPDKAPTAMIEENIKIMEDMKEDYESMY